MTHSNPQLKIRLKPAVKQWLESKAKAEERSQTWLLNKMAEEAMHRDQQKSVKNGQMQEGLGDDPVSKRPQNK